MSIHEITDSTKLKDGLTYWLYDSRAVSLFAATWSAETGLFSDVNDEEFEQEVTDQNPVYVISGFQYK